MVSGFGSPPYLDEQNFSPWGTNSIIQYMQLNIGLAFSFLMGIMWNYIYQNSCAWSSTTNSKDVCVRSHFLCIQTIKNKFWSTLQVDWIIFLFYQNSTIKMLCEEAIKKYATKNYFFINCLTHKEVCQAINQNIIWFFWILWGLWYLPNFKICKLFFLILSNITFIPNFEFIIVHYFYLKELSIFCQIQAHKTWINPQEWSILSFFFSVNFHWTSSSLK